MKVYLVWTIVGFILLIIELMTPTLFFLNLAAGAFFASCVAYFYPTLYWAQILTFTLVSILCILFLRPIIMKKQNNEEKDEKYVGYEAKVVETVNENGGKIKIYDEIWPAKNENNEEIIEGENVKIIKFENMTMYVEKMKGE